MRALASCSLYILTSPLTVSHQHVRPSPLPFPCFVQVELTDTRSVVGILMAFDKHMNIVLGECEEVRLVKPTEKPKEGEKAKLVEEKRTLGLLLLRGDAVISMKPVSPPAAKPRLKSNPSGAPGEDTTYIIVGHHQTSTSRIRLAQINNPHDWQIPTAPLPRTPVHASTQTRSRTRCPRSEQRLPTR